MGRLMHIKVQINLSYVIERGKLILSFLSTKDPPVQGMLDAIKLSCNATG